MKKRVNRQYLLKLLLAILGCLVLEGIIFNYSALSTRHLEPDGIDISRNSSKKAKEIIINDIEAEISTVYVSFSGSAGTMNVQAWITDDARRNQFVLCDEYKINPSNKNKNDAVLKVESNGRIHRLKLTWDKKATLEELEINNAIPYIFNPVRFLIMFVVCFTVITIQSFHLNSVVFDPSDKKQLLIYTGIMLGCICLSTVVFILLKPQYHSASDYYSSVSEYPFENIKLEIKKVHAVMFDALNHKGVVQVTPDPKLLALDNPYDPSQRSQEIITLWDYALYNGQYYSYFGLTPVLIYYYPFYLVHGYLPSYLIAAHFFAILTIIGCFACVWEFTKHFVRETSALLLFILAPSIAWGSNILLLQSCPDRYYLSVQSMQAFFFLTLWAGIKAISEKRRLSRSFYYILCALFTFLLVWSRPTGAIVAAGWIIPLFICVLFDHDIVIKNKIADILSFMIPLCIGALIVINYNQVRFDSPFEFGQFHQLTIEDIHYKKIKIKNLFAALWYIFFSGYTVSSDFPWIHTTKTFINHSGNYVYASINTGAMIMPLSWGVFLLTKGSSNREKKQNLTLLSALSITVVVALTDYCIAGVHQRYSCDILPTLCLAGSLLIMKHAGKYFREGKTFATRICWLICIFTFITAFCLVFSNERNIMAEYSPDKYLFFVNMLSIR